MARIARRWGVVSPGRDVLFPRSRLGVVMPPGLERSHAPMWLMRRVWGLDDGPASIREHGMHEA